jgi:hypothetical protein
MNKIVALSTVLLAMLTSQAVEGIKRTTVKSLKMASKSQSVNPLGTTQAATVNSMSSPSQFPSRCCNNFQFNVTTLPQSTCNQPNLIASVVGGTPPYSFFAGTTFLGQTSDNLFVFELPVGTYIIKVVDQNGSSQQQVQVTNPCVTATDCTSFSVTAVNIPLCNPNGLIAIAVAGGLPPYTYSVSSNGGTFTPIPSAIGTTNTIVFYPACNGQTLSFQVTDSNTPNCIGTSQPITVNNPCVQTPPCCSIPKTVCCCN